MNKVETIKSDFFQFSHTVTQKPEQEDFKMHTHEQYELYYFVSGKGVFHIEGTDYPLCSGDILILDNTESHYVEVDCNYPYERFVVHFKEEYIRRIDGTGKLLEIFEKRTPGKNNLFREENFENKLYLMLINNMISGMKNNRIQTETNFYALLNEIASAFCKMNSSSDITEDTLVNRIANYILSNLSNQITLDDICEEFFVCKSQLCRMFKKTMGSTVWNYVTIKRLAMARELLESGELPTQVYLKCGFLDYSNFYRAYKKYYGTSPTSRKIQ